MTDSSRARVSPPGLGPKITSIMQDVSAEALGELRLWLEQNPPAVPITSILGFSRFTAQSAPFIVTIESTTSTTATDLATVGPTLTGLSAGRYIVLYGAQAFATGGNGAVMGLSVNGAAAAAADNAVTHATDYTSIMIAVAKTLSGGSNSLTAKYSSSAGSSVSFAQRWLIAIRYANL